MRRAVSLVLWGLALASPVFSEDESARLGTIHVRPGQQGSLKPFEIFKTEVIPQERFEHQRSQTVAEAVKNQVGVDAQNSCANCGSKRVTINGLRGEHTTVLVDGVPMHSAVSSFYGMDAIPVVGIESIEVSRGSGASLIAPEAIGGVLNLVTVKPQKTGFVLDGSWGNQSTGLISVLGTVVGGEGKYRLLLAAQASNQGFWDVDRNAVSEAPNLKNQSFFVKGSVDLTPKDRIEARYARLTLDILGGTTTGFRPTTYPTPATDTSLDGTDVTHAYTDAQAKITDLVDLGRHEGMARWNHFFSSDTQLQVTASAANQQQSSLYMHGYDYSNFDRLYFTDGRLVFSAGDNHFLTAGFDLKNQDLSSSSQKLYTVDGLPTDAFSYRSRAAYLQDVWSLAESVEFSGALRLDEMKVNWLGQTAKEFELEKLLLSPRLNLKAQSGPFTHRLSYGYGYRPPLSFFESQHGLNENGFLVEITEVETAHSLGYSINYQKSDFTVTGSSHYTWLRNMAYARLGDTSLDPSIFSNYGGELRVWANDIVLGWQVTPQFNLQLGYENYWMHPEFKKLLPAAAVEQRVRLVSDWHIGRWEIVNTLTWVGPRNLAQYGYNQHYRNLHDDLIDPEDPGLGTAMQVNELKAQNAPGYVTWDLYVGWKLRDEVTLFGSVSNLTGFTQTSAGDSPLNWASHGVDKTHYHLDNNHTWGPLRGRVFAAGLKVKL